MAYLGEDWDQYLLSTQYFCNLKVSEVTGSTSYSLVFARKANELEDYSKIEENPLSIERLSERLNYMNLLVFPAIVEKVNSVHHRRNEYFTKRNRIITDQFMPGAMVMVKDETRPGKLSEKNNYTP
jgi:hypothetical protein